MNEANTCAVVKNIDAMLAVNHDDYD